MPRLKKGGKGTAAEKAWAGIQKGLLLCGSFLKPLTPLLILGLTYGVISYLLWLPMRDDPHATFHAQNLAHVELDFQPQPSWIPSAELGKIKYIKDALIGHSVFEPGLAGKLADAFKENVWIERVGRINLRYPAQAIIKNIELRRPFALLENRETPVVLDRSGFILPPFPCQDLADPKPVLGRRILALPSITGVPIPRLSPGKMLLDPEIREGIDLLNTTTQILNALPGPKRYRVVRGHREPAGTWRAHLDDLKGFAIEWGYWADDMRAEDEPPLQAKKNGLLQKLSGLAGKGIPLSTFEYIRLDDPRFPLCERERSLGAGQSREDHRGRDW